MTYLIEQCTDDLILSAVNTLQNIQFANIMVASTADKERWLIILYMIKKNDLHICDSFSAIYYGPIVPLISLCAHYDHAPIRSLCSQ